MLDEKRLITTLQTGKLIAYPTEAVFGLGCDPFNETAVHKLLALKQRSVDKGLILIACDWQQITPLIQALPPAIEQTVRASWPDPVTWLLPATAQAPGWITGGHNTIALRITQHPLARRICQLWGKPVVSTSANLTTQTPCTSAVAIRQYFDQAIDYIIDGELGELSQPTTIFDALTGTKIR
jgi:L-threonylcarbamoyladenylate synthase